MLLDASFIRRADRQETSQVATAHRAHVLFVECICPREVALKRLAQRWRLRIERGKGLDEEAPQASDGRPDLYDVQYGVWEAFVSDLEPYTEHITVTTTQPLAANIEQVLEALHMPHFACWL